MEVSAVVFVLAVTMITSTKPIYVTAQRNYVSTSYLLPADEVEKARGV